MAFCVAIHPELVALDEELRPFGGFARAYMWTMGAKSQVLLVPVLASLVLG